MSTPRSPWAGLQKVAYESLSHYFREHEDEVVEIEVLPPAIAPPDGILMQDGLNVGIPKKILALAYMEARQKFFETHNSEPETAAYLQATRIILLFDPEHLTAANFRKRRLSRLKTAFGLHTGTAYHTALRQELCFLDSILTSPLHRQSKSPTLWNHRFWMIDSLMVIELEAASEDQKSSFWQHELDAVCRSGEQHPKNYHAWQYARRLMDKVESPGLREQFAFQVKGWCYRHPSDISGWSFLLHLMSRLEPASLREEMLRDVVNYAIGLRSEQESIWVFIRMALARDTLCEEHQTLYQKLQGYKEDLVAANKYHSALKRVSGALTWFDIYGSAAGTT
jgi:hypothetical protein